MPPPPQMLAMPSKMVTDHFDAPATSLMSFWIRGQSVSLLGLSYCVTQLPAEQGVLVSAVSSFAIGVLYPWNAKFGYINKDLPGELLMLPATVRGRLSCF